MSLPQPAVARFGAGAVEGVRSAVWLRSWVTVGAFGSGAVDFVDLLHGGDLSVGFGITTGALVGVDL